MDLVINDLRQMHGGFLIADAALQILSHIL
jgi:hypothetical protein